MKTSAGKCKFKEANRKSLRHLKLNLKQNLTLLRLRQQKNATICIAQDYTWAYLGRPALGSTIGIKLVKITSA